MAELYHKGFVHDLERALDKKLREQVGQLDYRPDEAATITERMKAEFAFIPPELDLPDELVPSRQSERLVHDDGTFARLPFPQEYKVLDIVYEINIIGTADLLDWTPQSLAFNYSSSPPERAGSRVRLKYTVRLGEGLERIQQQIKGDIDLLKRNVAGLNQWAQSWNDSLDRRLNSILAIRSAEIQRRDSVSEGLRIRL